MRNAIIHVIIITNPLCFIIYFVTIYMHTHAHIQKKSVKNAPPTVLSRTSTRHQKRKIDEMEMKSAMELEIENLSKASRIPETASEGSEQDITPEAEVEVEEVAIKVKKSTPKKSKKNVVQEVEVEAEVEVEEEPIKTKKSTPKKATKKSVVQEVESEVEAEVEVDAEVEEEPIKTKKLTPKKVDKKNKAVELPVEEIEVSISKPSKIPEPRVSSRNKKPLESRS